jgi:hypothetical protein
MSSVVISGDTSGAITLSATAVAGTNTITLPAKTGTTALTNQVIGQGQTTAAYTGSRALGTVYTNSTTNTIVVYGSISNATGNAITLCTIDGTTIQGSSVAAAGANYYAPMLVVPAGSTYSLNMNGSPVLQAWYETR